MSAVVSAPIFDVAPTWRQASAALAIIVLVLLTLYFDTARSMVEIWWRSGTFNHAFLVPPISLWLVWEKRHALAQVYPRPTPWLALPLALIAVGWLMAELVAVNVLTQFALVTMLVLSVPLVIGFHAAKRIAFPLGFLFFAVPFGEFMMPTMMAWTAKFTVIGLRASGIPVYQEGLHFVIPSGRWSVVEACSGVRYLIASIVVGTLYAYLNYRSLKRRLIFIGVAILVPIFANWLRAYMIVMLGHLSGNTLAVGVDHLIYGWVFFGIVMLIMFASGLRWREADVPTAEATPASVPLSTAGRRRLLGVTALTVAIAIAPRAALLAMDSGSVPAAPPLTPEALAVGGWQIADTPLTDWQPAYANPVATLKVTLQKDDKRIGVFIAYYRQQDYQRKLITSTNQLVTSNDAHWALIAQGRRDLTLAGQTLAAKVGTLRSLDVSLGAEAPRLLVWHWYWIDGHHIGSDLHGKLQLALSRLAGRGDESAAVFVYAYEPDGEAILTDYLTTMGGAIDALLARVAAQRH